MITKLCSKSPEFFVRLNPMIGLKFRLCFLPFTDFFVSEFPKSGEPKLKNNYLVEKIKEFESCLSLFNYSIPKFIVVFVKCFLSKLFHNLRKFS